jgi:ankyrin repeat protein
MPTLEETREKVTELKNLLTSGESTPKNLERLEELLLKDKILAFATRNGDDEIIAKFLQSKIITQNPALLKETVIAKDDDSRNELAQAVLNDNTEAVKALLNCDIITKDLVFFEKLLRAKVEYKSNVLFHVESAETLKAFLENPTLLQNPDLLREFLNHKDGWQRNPLVLVVFVLEKTEILEALLNNSFLAQNPDLLEELLNHKDSQGRNALALAVFNGDTKTVKAFLDSDIFAQNPDLLKELLNHKDKSGFDVLALAQLSSAPDMKEILLGHEYKNPTPSGEALDHQDIKGNSEPPASAIISNLGKMTEPPLQKGPIINDVSDLTNKIIKEIKSPRSENLSEFFQSLEEEEKEILVQAINTPVFLNLSTKSKILKSFRGSETQNDSKHRTPLQLAAELGNVDVMRLLIEKGADVNAVNKNRETALGLAKRFGKKGAVSFLEDPNSVPSSSVSVVLTTNPIHEKKGKEGGGSKLP